MPGQFLTTSIDLRCPTGDGWHMQVLTRVQYRAADGTLYETLPGTETDGLSTPPPIWPLIPPMGKLYRGGLIHDAGYKRTLLIVRDDGTRSVANLTKLQCDALLREMVLVLGASEEEANTIYAGVHYGGWSPWVDDLSLPIPKIDNAAGV